MTDTPDPIHIRYHTYEGYHVASIDAGPRELVHVVPPAGERYAFDRQEYARRVEVSVSPTGRSVRVWVDGTEVKS